MWSSKVDSFSDDSMHISGQEVPIKRGVLHQGEIQYWQKNPRIYSIVHASNYPLDQDEIQIELQSHDHVKQLMRDIRHHGGLIEPIVVIDETFEVIEGNSRLAALRFLSQKDPIRFSEVRCAVLPKDIDETLIYSYLNQEHIQGKTQWSPYEQAGVIYRLISSGKKAESLYKEMNISVQKARKMFEVYEFMIGHGEDKPSRYSYYEVYLSNRKAKAKRSVEPQLDKKVVSEIRKGDMTAQQFRSILPIVCDSPKQFTKFVSGKSSLVGAYELLEEQGKTGNLSLRLKRLHQQFMDIEKSDFDGLTVSANKDAKYRLDRMVSIIKTLRDQVYGTE